MLGIKKTMACVLLAATFLQGGCKKTEEKEWELAPVAIIWEGPLMEGPNTAQVAIDELLQPWCTQHQCTVADITHITPKSITITTTDSLLLTSCTSLALQAVSDDSKMLRIGIANPLVWHKGRATLTTTPDADLLPIANGNQFFWIMDANFAADTEATARCTMELLLTIGYKK
jgi:hypothetical protein